MINFIRKSGEKRKIITSNFLVSEEMILYRKLSQLCKGCNNLNKYKKRFNLVVSKKK